MPDIERIEGATTEPALIVKFVVEAFALKVFVPAPEKITLLKAEFPVKVPAIV